MNGRRSDFRALTGRSARAALLTTTGHLDALVIREGGRIESINFTVPCRKPYAPHAVTLEIADRVSRDVCGRYVSLEGWQVYGVIVMPNGKSIPTRRRCSAPASRVRGSGDGGMSDG